MTTGQNDFVADADELASQAARREALIREIYTAFAGVSREGGVSWSEAYVIDMNGEEGERRIDRAQDKDTRWEELVDNSDWDMERGIGGWSFLDPIGFRYYLPAAMIRLLRDNEEFMFADRMTLSKWWLRQHTLEQWSALTLPQQLCIKHTLQYQMETEPDELSRSNAKKAFLSYWYRIRETAL